jgi:hypothetical protein
MTADQILEELKSLGREGYKKVLLKHGAVEPCYGVKIEELKKIQKRTGKDHRLALDLYESGVYDAMYLAGLIADDAKMEPEDLERWAEKACAPLAGSTVPGVAAGSPYGWQLGMKWIESERELVATAGWTTFSSLVSVKSDADLDLEALKALLERVRIRIHQEPDPVRYAMNGFVIAVGCFVQPLTKLAREVGQHVGKVTVDMGDTACQVPFAPDYIQKVEDRGTIGKKRKSAKC